MRGVATVEELRKDREAIIIHSIPYQLNKAALVERIAELEFHRFKAAHCIALRACKAAEDAIAIQQRMQLGAFLRVDDLGALDVADLAELAPIAADESFNCISVEGHTSTNDSLIFLANGDGLKLKGPALQRFRQAALQNQNDVN